MTVETETILIKLIEELKIEAKETNQRLTSIEVNQARLEGKIDALSVDVHNITEDIKELKDEVKGRISIQLYWFLLLLSLLIGIVGKFAFLPNP